MAMDSLASAARAAGFAMVPEDDQPMGELKGSSDYQLDDVATHWHGSIQPQRRSDQPVASERPTSIFDWMPTFSWRADGR